ncbi:hypothetical protein N7509_012632 [Penicillium cosmopolitanum]|uniref:Uncharacterized protein n=1 Tax=Penicillium cosmopolitanum TaxID=1131564 RepID=A0A9W9SNB1_9EURO|nr:uncharacterized protein N7509_012632 [Penicillium cosmopolitanum]KAJ5379513.1 hypothetical protein N7509_012632 [Penicillium cosmopolitanum]
MPPKQPAAPTISTWLKQTPDPDLQGKQVQYLVEFVNINGPSTISPGSGFAAILAGKAPQVFIPTDPDGAATKRNIYRQLIDSSGTTQNREKVDILNNNTTQVWVDGANLLKRGFLKHPQPRVPRSPHRHSRL